MHREDFSLPSLPSLPSFLFWLILINFELFISKVELCRQWCVETWSCGLWKCGKNFYRVSRMFWSLVFMLLSSWATVLRTMAAASTMTTTTMPTYSLSLSSRFFWSVSVSNPGLVTAFYSDALLSPCVQKSRALISPCTHRRKAIYDLFCPAKPSYRNYRKLTVSNHMSKHDV